ncbi:relaxase, partial [Salmonella enterica subsp. enterica serovar Panama]
TAIKLAEHQQRYPRAERQADGYAQEVSLNSNGVDIHLLRPADRHNGRDNLVSGHDHHLAPERDGQLQPAAGEPESEKRRGRD